MPDGDVTWRDEIRGDVTVPAAEVGAALLLLSVSLSGTGPSSFAPIDEPAPVG